MVELHRQNYKENKKIYNQTVKKLRTKIPNELPIDHVGSTAIPNMYGKNIIDILIGVLNESDMDYYSDILKELGFYPGNHNSGLYRFFASTMEETKKGDIHLHLVYINSDRYKDFLILKNYLLINKEEKKSYSDLKKKIIKDGNNVRSDYKTIKSEYVTNLINRAKEYMSNI